MFRPSTIQTLKTFVVGCRFDINDRKGLEIVILTALLTFQDLSGTHHDPDAGGKSPLSLNRQSFSNTSAPPPPPKPAPKTGVERIVEMQAMRGEINEITVEDEVGASDYAEYCAQLLQVTGVPLFRSLRCYSFCFRRMRPCCSSPSSLQILSRFRKCCK